MAIVQSPSPGQRLAGRYRIEALLGRGGMGAVYQAQDEQTGRPVAIKTILPAAGADQARRFRREFRALTRLSHPHIVTVHDSGQVDGLPFYVMEYIHGPDLGQLMAGREEPLPVLEAVTIGIQVGQALAYVHNQGIVHRDVKPANIMLLQENGRGDGGESLHVKLMDFGLVKIADVSAQLTSSGALVGTLKYLAPEQIKGLTVDRRADLYALGLVLFEMTTGGFPFSGTSAFDLAFQRLTRPPTPPWEFNPNLPPALSQLILKLLAADLNERYTSAEEALADLSPLADESIVLAPAPPRRADTIARSPLVGRDKEMEQLYRQLQDAWKGPGRFVLVEGEAGVGKTRLLQELIALARQEGGRGLQGGCYEEERIAYSPFVEALEGLVSRPGERMVSALEGLEAELGRLFPSLAVPAADQPFLEPEQARLRLFDAVARLFTRLGQERPVILVLNDLQWADEASLELLHYLVRNTQEAPVFICGTARYEELDEEHPFDVLLQGMSRRGMVERMFLERLSPAAVDELVAALLVGGGAPTQLAGRLYHEAEGNPFFVEEMLKVWVEEERLIWEGNGWQLVTTESLPGVSALSIPGSIADIVGRRLRGLPGVEMELLGLAAVLGREFNFDVLLQMAAQDEDTLLDAIEDLLRARLLEEMDHPREDRYRFAHKKIQEVVYTRLSRRRLRRLHRSAGEAMEGVYAGRLDRVIEPLARHFVEAGDRRGLEYGLQAGDAARAVYANQEALGYYGRALTLAGELWEQGKDSALAEQIITLCSGMGEVHFLVGEYEAALEDFYAVLELLPKTSLDTDECHQQAAATHRRLAHVHEDQGRYDEATAELQAALAALPGTKAKSRELVLIYEGIAWVQRRQGNYQAAIGSCSQGLQAVSSDDHTIVADLYDTLGAIHRDLGEYPRATNYHQRSLALREQLDDQPGIAKTCNYLAIVSDLQSDAEEAIAYNRRSLAISEKIGHSTGVASLYNNLGLIYSEQGKHDRAIQHYKRALGTFERIGNSLGVAQAYANLGEGYQDKGDLTRAIEYLQLALGKSIEVEYQEGVTFAHHLLAEIYLARRDLAQAIHSGQQALEIAIAIGARLYQAKAHHVLGKAYLALDQPLQARTHLETTQSIFEGLGDEEKAAAVVAALQVLD